MIRRFFSWPVIVPAIALILAVLLAVSVAEAFIARQEAIDVRNRTAAAAARRVDQLLAQIAMLQDRLRHTSVRDARERGRLEDAIKALAAQVRQSGGQPVTDGQSESANSNSPTPRPSNSPRPRPSHSPGPKPSPSPSCSLQHPLKCVPL